MQQLFTAAACYQEQTNPSSVLGSGSSPSFLLLRHLISSLLSPNHPQPDHVGGCEESGEDDGGVQRSLFEGNARTEGERRREEEEGR
eukprot:290087-Hanusia_phi.AAC.3